MLRDENWKKVKREGSQGDTAHTGTARLPWQVCMGPVGTEQAELRRERGQGPGVQLWARPL